MKYLPRQVSVAVLPLFISPEMRTLEIERERLAGVLQRNRKEHRHGAILKTEYRLLNLTSQILALSQGKEIKR